MRGEPERSRLCSLTRNMLTPSEPNRPRRPAVGPASSVGASGAAPGWEAEGSSRMDAVLQGQVTSGGRTASAGRHHVEDAFSVGHRGTRAPPGPHPGPSFCHDLTCDWRRSRFSPPMASVLQGPGPPLWLPNAVAGEAWGAQPQVYSAPGRCHLLRWLSLLGGWQPHFQVGEASGR